jgi:hypothetical protein
MGTHFFLFFFSSFAGKVHVDNNETFSHFRVYWSGVNFGCGHRELTQATSIRKNAFITWSVQVGYLGLRKALEFVHSAATRSSDSRASALLWGRSESELAYPLRPDGSLSSPQHTDLHKTLDTSPTARCRTLCKKPLTSPMSQELHNPTKKKKLTRPSSSTLLLGAPQHK